MTSRYCGRMSAPFSWDPDRYLAFSDERGRPFVDLVARIGAEDPRTVVDLGCGAGNLTVLLAQRWPGARVLGVDSSEEMVRAAPSDAGVEFTVGDIREWPDPADPIAGGSTYSSPTPRCSGSPDTSTSCPGWSARSLPAAGWPSRSPATSTSRATPFAASWPPSRRTPSTPPVWPCRTPTTPRPTCTCSATSAARWMPGRRPTCTCSTVRTRSSRWVSGTGARPTLEALPADLRAGVRGGVQGAAARGLPRAGGRRRAAVPPGLRGRPHRLSSWVGETGRMTLSFFTSDGDALVPTDLACSLWSEDQMHGVALSGALARALERAVSDLGRDRAASRPLHGRPVPGRPDGAVPDQHRRGP